MKFTTLTCGHNDLEQLLNELAGALPNCSEEDISMAVAFMACTDILEPLTGKKLWQCLIALCPGTGDVNFPNLVQKVQDQIDDLDEIPTFMRERSSALG